MEKLFEWLEKFRAEVKEDISAVHDKLDKHACEIVALRTTWTTLRWVGASLGGVAMLAITLWMAFK